MKHFLDLGTHKFEGLKEFTEKLSIDTTWNVYCYEANPLVYNENLLEDIKNLYNDIELQNDEVTKGYNFELHLDGKFLHYRAATNWHSNWRDSNDPLVKKTEIFNSMMEIILND